MRGGASTGNLEATNVRLGLLCNNLERVLERPVIDETRLNAAYDFALSFDSSSTRSVISAVHESLGLELAAERRAMDVVVLEKIARPAK